jgi:hypothetical protein
VDITPFSENKSTSNFLILPFHFFNVSKKIITSKKKDKGSSFYYIYTLTETGEKDENEDELKKKNI